MLDLNFARDRTREEFVFFSCIFESVLLIELDYILIGPIYWWDVGAKVKGRSKELEFPAPQDDQLQHVIEPQ